MANTNPSTSLVYFESSELRGTNMADTGSNMLQPPLSSQGRISFDGPVAILWDIENCPVPSDVRPEDVAGNIRMALRVHPIIHGAVMMFSAYGDFNAFPRRLREGCQRTGVKLVDVPNGRKDAADKAILVDMFLFALDNPPPSSIMLISGDVDFAPALHILGQRGYTIILVLPSNVGVSSALSNAGKFVWDWPSVARGEGFVPPAKALMPPRAGQCGIAGYFMGCHLTDSPDCAADEEAIVYGGVSQSYCNSKDISFVSQSLFELTSTTVAMPCFPSTSRSHSLPSGLNEVTAGGLVSSSDQNEYLTSWVQPGDLNGLKGQLVKLLELSGGSLPLTRVPAEYQKVFGRPLYVSEYGVFKLVNLFKKMVDTIAVEGKGQKKFVYLRNWKMGPGMPPLVFANKEKKGKGVHEDGMDVVGVVGSSDELSDDERGAMEEYAEGRDQRKTNHRSGSPCDVDAQNLVQFKHELQEILVSYSCRIFLGCFEAIYEQRYKKPLDYQKFGVDRLEDLFVKMDDVVTLHEEPTSKMKFLAALGC